MKRLLPILAAAAALSSPPVFAVSAKGCATGGSMVESFAMLRDQHKPIGEVDAFIDKLPGVEGDKQQADFYKKLARATYAQPRLSPAEVRESFINFCSSSSAP